LHYLHRLSLNYSIFKTGLGRASGTDLEHRAHDSE
jgi:hypothetical protein